MLMNFLVSKRMLYKKIMDGIMSFYEIWGESGLQALGSSKPIEFTLI
jgi:hypothetical protein